VHARSSAPHHGPAARPRAIAASRSVIASVSPWPSVGNQPAPKLMVSIYQHVPRRTPQEGRDDTRLRNHRLRPL
jgi:hypothetical protein